MNTKQSTITLFFCFVLANFVNGGSHEQFDRTLSGHEMLRVATIQRTPFAFRRGEVWSGYSIDLLHQLEATLGKQATIVEASSIDELLRMVEEGQVDCGIGNISVTAEREKRIDFSHPIYASGLQVAVSDGQTIAGLFPMAMFSTRMVRIVAAAGIVLLFVAHGLWFFERGSERDFRDSYYNGIWDAFWWAAVTVTTVGYGDQVPRSNCGRLVGLTWMFASLFLVTIFVAHTTNALSGHSRSSLVNGPGTLTNKRVASVIGSTAEAYLKRAGYTYVVYENPDAMFAAVIRGDADALVYDAPVVYHRSKLTGNGIIPVGPVFNHEDIGIALPEESDFREPINRALLALKSTGVVEQVREQWFD